jgi:RNA polymerase sigma factor (sigma-70 family)
VTEERRVFWARKFVEYRVALNGYFRRRVAHPQEAEDLAQEVYMRLLRANGGEHTTIANPEAYLYTVALNLLRERALLQKRKGCDVTLEEAESELIASEPNPDVALDEGRSRRWLADVIKSLPPKFRAALVMHYHHGMTYQEIAAKMGVTDHAVKKNISRGLQACRRKVAKE